VNLRLFCKYTLYYSYFYKWIFSLTRMVDYTCPICKVSYVNLDAAQRCEERGIVGPDIDRGLLLSHKKVEKGFMIIYGESNSKGHEKVYFLEEIRNASNNLTWPLGSNLITASKLRDWLSSWRISTDEEVGKLNKILKDEIQGTKPIKAYLDVFNIKELHNKCNLDDLL
jgi:hypothetical protein